MRCIDKGGGGVGTGEAGNIVRVQGTPRQP